MPRDSSAMVLYVFYFDTGPSVRVCVCACVHLPFHAIFFDTWHYFDTWDTFVMD